MRFLDAIAPRTRSTGRSARGLADAYGLGNSDPFAIGAGGFSGFGTDNMATYAVNGISYVVPVTTTMPGQKAESISASFEGYVNGGLFANSIIFALTATRLRVFKQARFQFQNYNKGRPGDLFATKDLSILERPWPGGVTGDLLAIMLLDVDFSGNSYITVINGQMVRMRPDWVSILLGERKYTDSSGLDGVVGLEKLGYLYYQGGASSGVKPMAFLADEVSHFLAVPDPLANYRGMSWLTPVVREVQADQAAATHKLKFWENASTPNLAVSLKEITDPTQFEAFVDKMDEAHQGLMNAYKTLYLGAGADVTVIGKDMQQMDFANVIAAGEVRLAAAAGVHPTVAGLSEGLQGSSLNAGNFSAAVRLFSDITLADLWSNAAGSLEVLVKPPHGGSRLWYDIRDVPFLSENVKDRATIQASKAQAIRELFMAGFTPDSIIAAVNADDYTLLVHSNTLSIQVQAPGTTSTTLPSTVDETPSGPDFTATTVAKPAAVNGTAAPAALPAGDAKAKRDAALADPSARTNGLAGTPSGTNGGTP